MKKLRSIFIATAFVLFLSGACKKEEDPATRISSHTFSISTWYYSSPQHYVDLTIPELTAENLNSAGVMVYYSVSPGVWISVPYTVYGTLHDYHMGFLYNAGTVEVTWLYDGTSAGSDPNTYYSTTVKCKVVVVPSSVRLANPQVDWNNYDEVRNKFGLHD